LPLAALLPVLLFALTLFVSATLLFLVQPMVGKMLLPLLGGTPAVWNTCMVFFQAILLAGYAYAHASTAWLGVRRQALLHLGVLLLPLLTLGLTVDRRLLGSGEGNPIPGLLLVLLLSVGLPFFVVSTSAPLLQKWFAGTGHPAAKDPYFLYAASNLGSMVGLNGYVAVIEPWLTLGGQRLLWLVGYGVLVVLTASCALCLWRSRNPDKETWKQGDKETGSGTGPAEGVTALPGRGPEPGPVSLSLSRRLRWVALAFVPSSLMLGATTYMTTDIAAIPLLWVIPLDLYLLSFILVFSRLPAAVHRLMAVLLPMLVLLLLFLMLSELPLQHVPIWWKILVHLAVLFVAAMVCHGELARDRPPTRHLTEFFLWMSVGGVLGGLFNALVAPVTFQGLVEYPLALVLACVLTPTLEREKQTWLGPVVGTGLMGLFLGAGLALLIAALGRHNLNRLGLGDGLWLLAALLAALILAGVSALGGGGGGRARWLDLGLPAALGVLAVGLNLSRDIDEMRRGMNWLRTHLRDALPDKLVTRLADAFDAPDPLFLCLLALCVGLCYLFVKRPLRFGLGVGALLLAFSVCDLLEGDVLLHQRSFFGALQVGDAEGFRRLYHGTTLHGVQRLGWDRATLAAGAAGPLAASDALGAAVLLACGKDAWRDPRCEPQAYFNRTGPIGQVFEAYRDRLAGRHLGLIGLGSGTLASYGQPGQKLTYYEIDPLVKRIACDRAYFTYVQDARDRGVEVGVVLGDARLKLEERARAGPPEKFALLIVDAFSSDAIPMHLLTREALAVYLDNLADDGLLAFHISNRYLDLEPVLANLAGPRPEEGWKGLAGYIQHDEERDPPGKVASTWVLLARRESTLDRLAPDKRPQPWPLERGQSASREALLMLSAFPDPGGRVHAQGAISLTLSEHLRGPWQRLKASPEVGVWTDDYSNILRVFKKE
jgi:hypothetical protein